MLSSKANDYIQNHLPLRLLHVSDLALIDRATLQNQINAKITEDFFLCQEESNCPCFEKIKDELKYSILSHRWGSSELTFSDFDSIYQHVTLYAPRPPPPPQSDTMVSKMWRLWDKGTQEGPLPSNAQYARPSPDEIVSRMRQLLERSPAEASLDKLLQFRRISAEKQCKYAWLDTICINKESSAELDESIRSMYAWYRDSHICIVHLKNTPFFFKMKDDPWFTRGWTLQELLAPKRLKFFSSSWEAITPRENDKDLDDAEQQAIKEGKDQPRFWSTITDVTKISIDDLLNFKPGLYDIGKRMQWVSRRTTSRVEDMAYCLIGIFRVNLSIAYGEKEGAFYRLQAEIMQNSDDPSLFDWEGEPSTYNSMFASSPKCFSGALKFTGNNIPPLHVDQNSTSAVNFERRISRPFYDKSELPDLEIWKDTTATVFIVLAPPSKSNEYALMLLEQIGAHQQYKRLQVINAKIEELPPRDPSEILIK